MNAEANVDKAALIVADVQNDFCAGGSLEVPDAEHVVEPLNRYMAEAAERGVPVYVVRDWHPAVTTHFAQYGGPWPPHCIQGTEGARFHPGLRIPAGARIITKGVDPDSHGYSAFDGRTAEGKPFLADLQSSGIRRLRVGGLATDYCVRNTVMDALAAGLEVTVLSDAVAGVDPGASDRALAEMRERGARMSPA